MSTCFSCTKAYLLSDKLTEFYAKQVGAEVDLVSEFLLLSDWAESISAGLREAKRARLRWMIRDMLNFQQECNMLMSLCTDS